jgi:hypothetical protein
MLNFFTLKTIEMKDKLLLIFFTAVSIILFPKINFGQTPNLGTTADFVLFTTNGAVTNVGITHLTGHVGSNVGGSTGFGNVDGTLFEDIIPTKQKEVLKPSLKLLNKLIKSSPKV